MRAKFPDNTFVPAKLGKGNRLFIAEAPGREEAEQGEPLIGGAGRWLKNIVRKVGLRWDNISKINVIQCRPPNNLFPTDSSARGYISAADGERAVRHCVKTHVAPLLKGRKWGIINFLGEKPLRWIGEKKGGIFRWRGSPMPVPIIDPRKDIAIPTLHPAYIMRDQSMLPVVVNDLAKNVVKPPEHYIPFPTIEQARAFKAKRFAFDIETDPRDNYKSITMVGLASKSGEAICLPFRGDYVAELKRIFTNATEGIGHNCVQYDLPKLKEFGVELAPEAQVWDTMLMQHLLQPDLPHGLEFVVTCLTNKPAWKHEKSQNEALYCCRDTDATLQIWHQLHAMLRQEGLTELYKYVAVPLGRICKHMTDTGFKLDPSRIEGLREKFKAEMKEMEKTLPKHLRTAYETKRRRKPAPEGTLSEKTGKPIKFIMEPYRVPIVPWRSNAVIGKYLYEELKLPTQTHIKTGRITTDKQALERLSRMLQKKEKDREHWVALDNIRKLRKLDELVSTFVKKEMGSVDRIHPSFNVHGTASGRLSSSGPNIQNIPPAARYIYVPSKPGWKIVDVDYSQIENRLTAYFAGDSERLARFQNNPDFSEHKYAASIFFNIPYEEVEKDNDKDAPYGKAKRIVHGVNYGMGARKLCNMYDMNFQEVKLLINNWKAEIQPTTYWQERTADEAYKQGFLTTPFGRKRWFYTSSYFTESLSFIPQSAAADVIFKAMIALMYERIGWPEEKVKEIADVFKPLPSPARLLIQVHDSLVFECPEAQVDELVATVKLVMEQAWPELGGMRIPIGVAVGDSWAECKEYQGGEK